MPGRLRWWRSRRPDQPGQARSGWWVLLACGLLVLLAIFNGLFAFQKIQSLVDREHEVTHTQLILTGLEGLLTTLDDAESGQRGYILTGQESYLAPYTAARAQLPGQLDQLHSLLASEPAQEQRLSDLRGLINDKLAELQQTIDLRRSNQTQEAIQIVLSGRGQATMDQIRSSIHQMETTEDGLLTQRSDSAQTALEETTLTLVVATLADIVLLFMVFWLFRRVLTQRTKVALERAQSLEREQAARVEAERLEGELAERARELESLFDAMTDGLVVYDAQGRIRLVNPAGRRLLGLDVKGADYSALSPERRAAAWTMRTPDGRPLASGELPVRRVLRGEVLAAEEGVDVVVSTADGREVSLNASASPLRDAQGRVSGVISVFRDVTERDQLERRTHETLNALLEMATALVSRETVLDEQVVSVEEHLSRASGVARRLAELTCSVLGCSRVGLAALEPGGDVLRPVAVVGLSPEQERQWWAEQEQQQQPLSASPLPDLIARFLAGESLVIDLREPPFNEQPNPYGIVTMLAVPMLVDHQFVGMLSLDYGGEEHTYTEQELALAEAVAKLEGLVFERERLLRERAAAQANELALREANRQMDTFLSMASHELKTPLTTIKLHLQLAQRRVQGLLTQSPASVAEVIMVLEQMQEQFSRSGLQVQRLDRLVNDLLDVSRIQAGRLEMHLEPVDLAQLVRERVEEQQQLLKTRAIHLQPLPEQGLLVLVDAERIGQVVTNYLTNALKYSPESAPVEVGVAVEEGQARVWMRDQGPGLLPEEQQRVWERFHRAPGVEVQFGSGIGLGLGLHISRTIIEAHGGQVGVQSVPGQGSTFWFRLPLAE
jgi:signal transduction histidine kinase/CHASE3 domain sensor protein